MGNCARLLVFLSVIAATFVPSSILLGNSQNLPPGKTGAPGDGLCTQCHVGTPNNTGRVLLYLESRLTYSPGVKQRIAVSVVASQAQGVVGFQLTARLASNGLVQAGHFEPSEGVTVQRNGGLEYVNHVSAKALSGLSGSGFAGFAFDWTPPANGAGDVRFYLAAVAGQAGGQPGPNVYTASYTLTPATRGLPAGYRWEYFSVPGGGDVTATGISNDGRITGWYLSGGRRRGFLRFPDGSGEAFDAASTGDTEPMAVNSSGQVVGVYRDTDQRAHGFIRSANGQTTLFDVPGASTTELHGINDSGQIVGQYDRHGLLLTNPPQFQSFDVLGGTIAWAINSRGVILGESGGPQEGFLRSASGDITEFPFPCGISARGAGFLRAGLNDFGEIAGQCYRYRLLEYYVASFVSAQTGSLGIVNNTIAGPTGAPELSGINNAGQVVGSVRKPGDTALSGVIWTPCNASAASQAINIPAAGASGSVAVSAPPGCRWNAVSYDSWINLGPTQEGNGQLDFTVQANASSTARTGSIWAAGATITITQPGVVCDFTLSGPHAFPSQGGSGTLIVTAPYGCPWTATSDATWLQFTGNTSGNGYGSVTFTVQVNTTTVPRAATLSAGGQTLFVTQEAAPRPTALRFVPITPCRAVDTRLGGTSKTLSTCS